MTDLKRIKRVTLGTVCFDVEAREIRWVEGDAGEAPARAAAELETAGEAG